MDNVTVTLESHALFVTAVHRFTYPRAAEDHERWRAAIYRLRERDGGRVVSNHLGWQSSVPLDAVDELADLCQFIKLCVEHVAGVDGWALDRHDVVLDGWINVNGRGAMNNFHNHPNSLLSGTYYIDTPAGGGDLVFRDPREAAYMFQPPYTAGYRAPVAGFTPEPGMLIVFPSWLVHAVGPNTSDVDRISVAFNVGLAPRAAR
jgi:uncharacterized protein (TIGR02466 family)